MCGISFLVEIIHSIEWNRVTCSAMMSVDVENGKLPLPFYLRVSCPWHVFRGPVHRISSRCRHRRFPV